MKSPLSIIRALFAGVAGVFLAGVVHAEGPQVIDSHSHHLGFEGEREWRDLDGTQPEGRSLQIAFNAHANARAATIFIRQRDVKLKWPVLLNGRKLGNLDLIEYPEVATIAIPPGTLHEGENNLSILSPEMMDDIFVDEILLDVRPPAEAAHDGMIHVRVTDGVSHGALPCRITVADARGMLAPISADPGQTLAVRAGVVYTGNGEAVFGLPAGEYTIYATRGFEYGVAERKISVRAGSSEEVALQIGREVETPGLVACDTHIHTFTYSKHGDATTEDRVLTLAGEGIELAIASDHNIHADYADVARRLKVADYFTLVLGDEVTTTVGHFIAFPMASATGPLPDASLTDWPALMTSIRNVPGVQVVILNHPRDIHNSFIPFAPENFDAASGDNLRGPEFTFDAIEVGNSGTLQSDFMRSFRDWFALLNHGYRVTAVGSSDSHDVSRFIVGQGRTYIACDDAKPGGISVDEACRNLQAGHASVSMGLLTQLMVNDRFEAGDLATSLGDEIKVAVRVLGPAWVQADRVELYANGIKIREQAIKASGGGGEKARIEWRMPRPARDTYLVAIASGPGVTAPYWAIPLPYQPTDRVRDPHVIGATNPVWLDADGDGKFTSARGYAKAILEHAGGDAAKLAEALKGCDDSITTQVSALQRAQSP
ncbi:MAG: CehA/McbA family metallohydrolase [Chthoniobacter sp.]|uniref:CehA/McbA family metallohydrolase n=1 Tax=Chthoniobacter sp. TaxID=2510640 RepID=UPI0032A85BCF